MIENKEVCVELIRDKTDTKRGGRRVVVYYESLNRELKTKPINECRCDERLKTRVEESTRLTCPRYIVCLL